jgi:hypothetical protein
MKSEAISYARRCWSSWLTWWWTRKKIIGKMEGQGGGEAQGVTKPSSPIEKYMSIKIFTEYT